MAKRKLTEAQRKSLRTDIDLRLSGGNDRREVVKALSSKYKISPISMRWYLRTQPAISTRSTSAPAVESPSPGNEAVSEAPQSVSLEALGAWKPELASDQTLVELLNGLTHQKIKRLLEAKKLLPKLQLLRRHESELRGQIRLLEKKLESETGKARGVEEQIRRLTTL